MKNPFRSKTTRIREIMAELDTFQGQIEGLLDVSQHIGVEKVTGPIDVKTLSEIKSAIESQHSYLSMKDVRGISETSDESHAGVERRFAARDEIVSGVKEEIGKTKGIRGVFGMHRKNVGQSIAERAILAIEKACGYTDLKCAPLSVSDPFGRPKISAEHTKPDYCTPGW